MGTHGRTGLAHLVMGSVAEQVIRHAPCAVLVKRPRALAEGEPTASGAAPDLIDRERRARALHLLRAHFGVELAGDRQKSWQRMAHLLARELGLDSARVGAVAQRPGVGPLPRLARGSPAPGGRGGTQRRDLTTPLDDRPGRRRARGRAARDPGRSRSRPGVSRGPRSPST